MTARTIAIVEDESIIALDLQCICQDLGYQVLSTAATATQAVTKFSDTPPDILITDMQLADGSEGVEVVQRLRNLQPEMVVIFVTAAKTTDTLKRIASSNPDRVLTKPLNVSELHRALVETTS